MRARIRVIAVNLRRATPANNRRSSTDPQLTTREKQRIDSVNIRGGEAFYVLCRCASQSSSGSENFAARRAGKL